MQDTLSSRLRKLYVTCSEITAPINTHEAHLPDAGLLKSQETSEIDARVTFDGDHLLQSGATQVQHGTIFRLTQRGGLTLTLN